MSASNKANNNPFWGTSDVLCLYISNPYLLKSRNASFAHAKGVATSAANGNGGGGGGMMIRAKLRR